MRNRRAGECSPKARKYFPEAGKRLPEAGGRVPELSTIAPRRRAVGRALRAGRRYLTPGWLAVHLLVWTAVIAMVLLGRWQLEVSNRRHFDLQNFSYVLQWWAFAGFAVWFWVRTMRDARRPPATPAGSGELVLRDPSTGIARVGPTDFLSSVDSGGPARIAYRGYVMPDSGTRPVSSHGDSYHDSYNDHLWQLGLADAAADIDAGRVTTSHPRVRPVAADARPRVRSVAADARPRVRPLAPDARPVTANALESGPTAPGVKIIEEPDCERSD